MAAFGGMAAAWLLAAALVQAARAQINVMAPSSLAAKFKHGRIMGSTTTIGAPFYGERVLGQLVYSPSTSDSAPHCAADDYDLPRPMEVDSTKYQGQKEVRLINIAVVKRGGCAFSTKVRVAAEKGAHAVVIIDKPDSTYTQRQMNDVIVAEEAYVDDIHIPSVFICKADGQAILDEFANNHVPIVVELAWNVPTKTVVTVDQWMSSASSESLKFLRSFAPKRRILNQVLRYQPHFTVFSMGSGGSAQTTSKLCTDQTGKFCAEDPDGDGPVQGKDVLEEDLRQLCLHDRTKVPSRSREYQDHKTPPEFADKYWSYIEQFQNRCPITDATGDEAKQFGPVCSYQLMKDVGLTDVDIGAIRECADVGSQSGMEALKGQMNHTAWSPRALRINGWRYSGILDAELVATAVCAGFSKEPEECLEVKAVDRNFFKAYVPMSMRSNGVSFGTMIAWLLVTVAIAAGAFFMYKQYLKKDLRASIKEEVMLEVESQMAQYGRLRG